MNQNIPHSSLETRARDTLNMQSFGGSQFVGASAQEGLLAGDTLGKSTLTMNDLPMDSQAQRAQGTMMPSRLVINVSFDFDGKDRQILPKQSAKLNSQGQVLLEPLIQRISDNVGSLDGYSIRYLSASEDALVIVDSPDCAVDLRELVRKTERDTPTLEIKFKSRSGPGARLHDELAQQKDTRSTRRDNAPENLRKADDGDKNQANTAISTRSKAIKKDSRPAATPKTMPAQGSRGATAAGAAFTQVSREVDDAPPSS